MSGDPTTYDPNAIPTDPRLRVVRVPIPLTVDGKPATDRAALEPAERARLKAIHSDKVAATMVRRAQILQRCEHDIAYREMVLEACKRSIVFWIDHFAFSFDDREDSPVTPIVLFDAQRREVEHYQNVFLAPGRERVQQLDEKSRAWGASWVLGVFCRLHSFLFREGHTVLFGHDKLEKLDDGGLASTHQTTFGKIRFAYRHLPAWMLPPDLENERGNKIGLIKHPTKPNMLAADFYHANFGRGDRFTEVVCDEAASSEKFGVAATSFKQTTRRVHMFTTPRGRDNDFGRLRFGPQKKTIHTLHWPDNPNLDVDWYWEQREHYTPEEAAQELDVSYDLSASNRVYKNFDRRVAVQKFAYDPLLPLTVAVDPGYDDPFALVFFQTHAGTKEWRIVDFICRSGQPGLFYVPFLTGKVPERTMDGRPWPFEYDKDDLAIIARHASWNPLAAAIGGADGAAASVLSGEFSLYDLWEEYGVPSVYPTSFAGAGGRKDEAIRRVEIALPRLYIADYLVDQRTGGDRSPTIVECFEQYSWVDRSANKTGRRQKREPKHDLYCHGMDAVQMFLWWEDVVDPQELPIRRRAGEHGGTLSADEQLPPRGGGLIVPDYSKDRDPVSGP